jgi:hypothetical protein
MDGSGRVQWTVRQYKCGAWLGARVLGARRVRGGGVGGGGRKRRARQGCVQGKRASYGYGGLGCRNKTGFRMSGENAPRADCVGRGERKRRRGGLDFPPRACAIVELGGKDDASARARGGRCVPRFAVVVGLSRLTQHPSIQHCPPIILITPQPPTTPPSPPPGYASSRRSPPPAASPPAAAPSRAPRPARGNAPAPKTGKARAANFLRPHPPCGLTQLLRAPKTPPEAPRRPGRRRFP